MPVTRFRCILFAVVWAASAADAAVITFAATNVTGTTWRYDYTVSNHGAIASQIELFDILFDPALYSEASLSVVSSPSIASGWDQLILASGVGVPAAYDVLATGTGIGIGQSVSGFAVGFTWLGAGTPGPQGFQIYNPDTFALLGTGTTSAVPVPASLLLMATALSAAVLRTRRRRSA